MEGNLLRAILLPSRQQVTDLEMSVQVLPNDLIRVRALEQQPYKDRHRFEATDVLIPGRRDAI